MIVARIKETLAALAPINPRYWRWYSHALAQSEAWVPPFFMIVVLAVALLSHAAVGWLGNWHAILAVKVLTWITWLMVGLGANGIVLAQSLAHLWRFGIWGWSRPRWWFELARFLWIAGLLSFLSFGVAVLVPPKNLGPVANHALDMLFRSSKRLVVWSFIAASVGYAASFLLRRPRRGRAFRCIHYFYTLFGGIALVSFAAIAWPPAALWPNGVVLAVEGIAGLGLFVGGCASAAIEMKKSENEEI